MNHDQNENRDEDQLDDLIRRSIDSANVRFDADKWKQKYPQETEMLASLPRRGRADGANLWRATMKKRITKLTAAAVVVLAVVAGLCYLGSGSWGGSVAWGEVARRVSNVQTYRYQMHATDFRSETGMDDVKSEHIITGSAEFGIKMEKVVDRKIVLIAYHFPDLQNLQINIMPTLKMYMRIEHPGSDPANLDPRHFVAKVMKSGKKLGRDVIDGITVEGIECTLGGLELRSVYRIWVDVETGWPVVMEDELWTYNGKLMRRSRNDNYQWDVELDAREFEPVIPEGYTEYAPPQRSLKMDLDSALKGLKVLVELTGHYPEQLDQVTVRRVINEVTRERQEKLSQNEDRYFITELLCFYPQLVEDDKHPAYYGESVGPEDVDAILMRWKIGEDEYKVVYGDLTVETVSAEQLAELEAGLVK